MSVIHNDLLLATDEATGYNLTKSVRLRASASAYLSRTLSTPTNSYKWTWSGWVKKANIGSNTNLFNAYTGSNNRSFLTIYSGSEFSFYSYASGSYPVLLTTSQVLRDPSGWYHIVLAYDSTQATSTNRVKGWVNGQQVTFNIDTTYPTQNTATDFNTATVHSIGRDGYNTNSYLDGYLTEVNFVDGQGLAATDFGETDTITGVWKPKAYTGTYGTNGFYLPFTDVATTSGSNAGLGKDFSGNGNYWTTNNISVTSGATYDSMTDVPTLTSATAANYSVLNRLSPAPNLACADGNLRMNGSGSVTEFYKGTVGVTSGKYYFEVTINTIANGNVVYGVATDTASTTNYLGSSATGWGFAPATSGSSYKYNNGTATAYGTATGTGTYSVAFDATSGKLWFSDNTGSWISSGDPVAGTNESFSGLTGNLFAALGQYSGSAQSTEAAINFGQRPFAYTPPTGFKALNTYNLPDSTIVKGNANFDIKLWTGNSSTQTISGLNFQPSMLWVKDRSAAQWHNITDAVRGVGKEIFTNATNAEETNGAISSFNSDGFSLINWDGANKASDSYVGWAWKGNGAGSSNTSGSITSTVSVNATAGFSVVTYAGNNVSGATIGHGLGVAPAFFIVKSRSGATNWTCYHQSLGNTYGIILNSTNAADPNTYWMNTSPTSTTFKVDSFGGINASGSNYVAYCWSEIAGFSKFGSYTGNGSTDGPFIYTGFRPKFVLIKSSSGAYYWVIEDSTRNPSNVVNLELFPNDSLAETNASRSVDFLSNGFKIRHTGTTQNSSGNTYIYAAFAENPFKNSLAR